MACLVEDGLMKSRLIEQVVAPIAAYICYLTLLSEVDEATECFIQLEASARAVTRASRNMADVASRVMAESDDEVMRSEMGSLLEPLMVSGQHVLLAAQKLSIQPAVREHREELVEATQNVLLGVVKVLLVEDDATVRKITTAARRFLDCLQAIGDATDTASLRKAFQAFSAAFLLLHNSLMNRVEELRDHEQRECVKTSVETLRRSISMLHTAMYTTIKHPTSDAAQKSKEYILRLVTSAVNEVTLTLKSSPRRSTAGSCGYYAETRARALTLLSDPVSGLFKCSNFDVLLRDLVFHSMSVANRSRGETRCCVRAQCKLVLELWSELRQIQMNATDGEEPKDLQENLRNSLVVQIRALDKAVVKATLRQITDTFVSTVGPLEELLNAVRSTCKADVVDGVDSDPIQTSWKTFASSADRLAEVASFISALATDRKSLGNVENSVSCLLRLKDGLAALSLELEGDSAQHHGALNKLMTFQQEWEEETEHLLNSICDVINVKDFIQLSVQEMERDSDQCVEACKSHDLHLMKQHIRLLASRMSHVVRFVRRRVDKSGDPIYRNGLLVLVKQAEQSLAEVARYATDTCDASFRQDMYPLLANSMAMAIRNFDVLHEGLDGHQHPHLLSPLREWARQLATTTPVPYREEAQETTNNQITTQDLDIGGEEEADMPKETPPEKINPEPTTELHAEPTTELHAEPTTELHPEPKEVKESDWKSALTSHGTDLLPLLTEVANASRNKNVEALNVACTQILQLSACYTQATREAASIVNASDHQPMESLRSELVTMTPQLVRAAQETAMSSVEIIDTVYKHCAQFSDLIRTTHSILLPATGMWYHAVKAMTRSSTASVAHTCLRELTGAMCLCADTVELVTSSNVKVRSAERADSIASLFSKLQKAQANTKNLADLLVSGESQSDEFDGRCILWALSIQVLLASLDSILGTYGRGHLSQHQMTPKKWFATMSENSLRIQEAARLSCSNCTDRCKAKLWKERDDVKALGEVYLQAADDLGAASSSGVLVFARTELLQRQLQIQMKSLCCILSEVNEEYVTAVQRVVSLARSAGNSPMDAEDMRTQFGGAEEFLLASVKTATEAVQECLHFVRDPRERSSLRFISDHLSFQMTEIVKRAELIMETQTVAETLSVEILTQCWAAEAHYLVDELHKVDGIFPATKEQIKRGLQGKAHSGVLQTDAKPFAKNTQPPGPVISDRTHPRANNPMGGAGVPAFSRLDPSLPFTSPLLKHEAGRWDAHTNQIVQVTQEMADTISDMTQYLKRKGPIQSKDAFVSSAKDLVLSCQTVTRFVKVIADHCVDRDATRELCIIAERMVTITNQLTIISSVNAVTTACKSSDEIVVKNAQNLLQTVIQGVRAAETACIKGLRQPEPNSEAEQVASLCTEWKKNLLIHRTQEQLNPEIDDLGLRKTSQHHATPSLAPSVGILDRHK